jgi:hypothetical protein
MYVPFEGSLEPAVAAEGNAHPVRGMAPPMACPIARAAPAISATALLTATAAPLSRQS